MEKPIIAWIVDVPAWAYDNRAKRIERALPDYHHVRYFNMPATIGLNGKRFMMWIIDEADVIVCPDPRLLIFFTDEMRSKIVQNLNAIKIFSFEKSELGGRYSKGPLSHARESSTGSGSALQRFD